MSSSSILPNKLDLSNDLRGSPSKSIAFSNEYGEIENQNKVMLVFTYTGKKQTKIDYSNGIIKDSLGSTCLSYHIENLDTKEEYGCSSNDVICNKASIGNQEVRFLNGQVGIMSFVCAQNPTEVNNKQHDQSILLKNDIFEGEVSIIHTNTKTNETTTSSGPVRIGINQ